MRRDLRHRLLGLALVALALTGSWHPVPGAAAGRGFATAEEAATALVNALRSGDKKAILRVLGPEGGGLVSSGDPVADRRTREAFVAKYDERHRFEAGDGKATLVVGKDDFPLPIPLVPAGPGWRFDTDAGKEEILNRRIGQNELNTIQVCLAVVDAQREYYARDPDRDGVLQYAQKFASTPGRRDGLYWPTRPGEPPSPLGDLVARARGEGYGRSKDAPAPYWGYYYRILNAQGKDAPGGAYSYLAHGRMMGGFAVVAYPAQYGASGVMTFLVNHDGVVYQKDLGPATATLARQMAAFNPDATWAKP
jgi:Protein of unknown function (DUF2950)